ncbi:MAG: hypothetical protein GX279_08270 [Clostridiaceae bacterium]|nr:hypothetical protein [Clostridiaceae bacterium]
MTDSASKARLVLIFGMIGIISVVFTIISDLILLGRPGSGYSFFLLPTECMAWISGWRITLGTFLGVFMLPFQIAGLVPLYIGLRPSGKAVPALTGLIGAHGLVMGVAFHTTYAFLAGGWKLYHSTTGPGGLVTGSEAGSFIGSGTTGLSAGTEGAGPSALMNDFQFYWKLIIVIMVTELILLSALYIITVLKGRTLFPKWMAVLNPAAIMTTVILILLALPAPVGGYAAPTMLNLSNFTFFIISTLVVYGKLKHDTADA